MASIAQGAPSNGQPRAAAESERVRPRLVTALEEARQNGVQDTHQLQQVIRRTVGSFVGSKLRRRPMIIPIVVDA